MASRGDSDTCTLLELKTILDAVRQEQNNIKTLFVEKIDKLREEFMSDIDKKMDDLKSGIYNDIEQLTLKL